MNWLPPLPKSAMDESGRTWQVLRAWPDRTPGDYKLEVTATGDPGVRAGHLRAGHFELVPRDDPGLPALLAEARQGEIIAHRPHTRAVVKAAECYIKVFRSGEATVPAERCAQTEILLGGGPFTAPKVMRSSADVIGFSPIHGRTLGDLSKDETINGASLALLWENWSLAWTAQVGAHHDTVGLTALTALPVHSPDVEVADLSRWLDRWLRHYENLPEASSPRDALCAWAKHVTHELLGSAPDPLVWAHGDLHDKQIIAIDGASALGLLDFDDTARAEAALDLANLDVHLEFLARRKRLRPASYITARRQVMAAAGRLKVGPDRFRAYSDAAWLRLACSPLPGRLSSALAALDDRASNPPVRRGQELMA